MAAAGKEPEGTSQLESHRILCLVWVGVSITITNHTYLLSEESKTGMGFSFVALFSKTVQKLVYAFLIFDGIRILPRADGAACHYHVQCSRHSEII